MSVIIARDAMYFHQYWTIVDQNLLLIKKVIESVQNSLLFLIFDELYIFVAKFMIT